MCEPERESNRRARRERRKSFSFHSPGISDENYAGVSYDVSDGFSRATDAGLNASRDGIEKRAGISAFSANSAVAFHRGRVVAPADSMIEQPTKPDFPRPPDPIDKPPPDVKPVPPPDIPVPNSPDVQPPTFPERGDGPPVT